MTRIVVALLLLLAPQQDLDQLELRVKPRTPEEELKSFKVAPGFRLELVASEPQIHDPVAAAFDEDGRLYVCGMGDYPYGPKPGEKPRGKVYLLDDRDGDGRYETSAVFVDLLPWPTGVACWDGGVFVLSNPDLWYFKDTDGDGRADVRRKVCSGFKLTVVEGSPNSLAWGPDNKIYGSSSDAGGLLVPEGGKEIRVQRQDFRFDPRTMAFEPVSGNSRFGIAFDEAGNRFCCSASRLAYHPVIADEYLARNPHFAVTGVTDPISMEERVYPVSGPEPWKVARQKFWSRFVNTAPEMHAGRFPAKELAPQGFVTGAAGIAHHRGGLFTGEPANNVVVRLSLRPSGVSFVAERPEVFKESEFIASTDPWFRPVGFAIGPDNALCILDMYREIIEYFDAIPEEIRKRIDVTSGWDKGRIWRLAMDGAKRPRPPRLGKAATADLVELLDDREPWWRATAQRLLYERRDPGVADALRALARGGSWRALWALKGLGALDDATLARARSDGNGTMREHAVRLSEGRAEIAALADDPEIRVRFQVALGLSAVEGGTEALARIAKRDPADPWIRKAVLLASARRAGDLLRALAAEPIAADLVAVIAARKDPAELKDALSVALASPRKRALVTRIAEAGVLPPDPALEALFEESRAAAKDDRAPLAERVEAVRLLAHAPRAEPLSELLDPARPIEVQRAAAQALGLQRDPAVAALLVARWRKTGPAVRADALEAFFRRPERLPALLDAIEKEAIAPSDLPADRRQALLKHKEAAIAGRAGRLFASSTGTKGELVKRYAEALRGLTGDFERGRAVFEKNCVACHVIGGKGSAVGTPLGGANLETDAVLVAVFDPNRDVQGAYVNYLVETKGGAVLSGIVVEETATSVTLRRAGGEQDVVLRSDIREMVSSRLSLMPEGLEAGIDPRAMADLLRFLQAGK